MNNYNLSYNLCKHSLSLKLRSYTLYGHTTMAQRLSRCSSWATPSAQSSPRTYSSPPPTMRSANASSDNIRKYPSSLNVSKMTTEWRRVLSLTLNDANGLPRAYMRSRRIISKSRAWPLRLGNLPPCAKTQREECTYVFDRGIKDIIALSINSAQRSAEAQLKQSFKGAGAEES